jgi:hypothetical protein
MLGKYIDRAMSWFRGPKPPEDPDAGVRQPVRRVPPSRSAGVALEEPVPPSNLNLFGILLGKSSGPR